MIHVQNASKWFGEQKLFEGISWHIRQGMRYGLVGANGAGKTTLLRMLMQQESCDGGSIVRRKGMSIGFLPQEVDPLVDGTVLSAVLDGVTGWARARDEVAAIHKRMADDHAWAASAESLKALSRADTRFEARGGDALVHVARRALSGLGFADPEIDGPAAVLSGGWLMRAALARLLVMAPDVLLLDEPTNHLDLEALAWFEDFLGNYEGAVIAVSHDRYFLSRMPERTVELSRTGLHEYVGAYDDWLEGRAARIDEQKKHKAKVDRKRVHLERFVERFRAKNTKAKQAQSRMKMLARLEHIEVDSDEAGIHLDFPAPSRVGKEVFAVEHVAKAWDDNEVYDDLNLTIWRGEQVALVGPNGAGKSTLLKLLAGATDANAGRIFRGSGVQLDYYAQHALEALDARLSVYQEAARAASDVGRSMIRGVLGALLFSGKTVDKRVAVLSGGEKARLALACTVLRGPNVLLLDEPTNHLDLLSREVLEQALNRFTGTVVMVSHDRAFINAVATTVLEVMPGGKVTRYEGDYDAYLYRKSGGDPRVIEALLRGEMPDEALALVGGGKKLDDDTEQRKHERDRGKADKRKEAEHRNEVYRRTAPLKDRIDGLEDRIAAAEGRIADLQNQQLDPDLWNDPDRARDVTEEHGRLRAATDKAITEWERLALRLEAVLEELGE